MPQKQDSLQQRWLPLYSPRCASAL